MAHSCHLGKDDNGNEQSATLDIEAKGNTASLRVHLLDHTNYSAAGKRVIKTLDITPV